MKAFSSDESIQKAALFLCLSSLISARFASEDFSLRSRTSYVAQLIINCGTPDQKVCLLPLNQLLKQQKHA